MNSRTFLIGLALALAMLAPARAAVFFAAHPDDIVLLMGRNAQLEIKSGRPTVLVVLTAGDGGNGNAPVALGGLVAHYYNQIGNPYFRVRHNAHEAAISTWVPADASARIAHRSLENFGEHRSLVEQVSIANVTIYNLNLPDGFLTQLANGPELLFEDVTGLNRYTSESLRDTLRQIVARHATQSPSPAIHLPEHTPTFSAPGYNDLGQVAAHADHADHTATGRLVRDALAAPSAFQCLRRVLYMGYAIALLPDSMSSAEKLAQVQAYAALDVVLRNQGNVTFDATVQSMHPGSMDAFHASFFGKQNTREEALAPACWHLTTQRMDAMRAARVQRD